MDAPHGSACANRENEGHGLLNSEVAFLLI